MIFDGSMTGSFHVAKHSVFVILGYVENTAVSVRIRTPDWPAVLARYPATVQEHVERILEA